RPALRFTGEYVRRRERDALGAVEPTLLSIVRPRRKPARLLHQPQPRGRCYGSRDRRGWGGRVGAVVVPEDTCLTIYDGAGRSMWRRAVLVVEAVTVPRVSRPVVGHRAGAVLSEDLGDHHSCPPDDRRRAVDGSGRTSGASVDDRH